MKQSLSSAPAASNRFRSRSALASVATLGALAAPSLIQAQIVWSGTLNHTVDAGTSTTLLDFNSNLSPDNPEAALQWYSDGKSDPTLSVFGYASAKTDPSIAFLYNDTPVALNATIDASFSYIGEHPGDLVPADGSNHYYAFAYQADGGPYYGWMELNFNADRSAGTLVQWAYNSVSGASITAGQTSAIPEPATYAALLGAVAAGAAIWRKRRRSVRAA
ncbi:MAG: PEP-CTERM sorting domain-containing protein [Verrucomicrobia bacterium]|nr:PEP-CTERM sorting domain-containing protein [Verrucomicrobiota bacterium]